MPEGHQTALFALAYKVLGMNTISTEVDIGYIGYI
jgi:hypothetical protein